MSVAGAPPSADAAPAADAFAGPTPGSLQDTLQKGFGWNPPAKGLNLQDTTTADAAREDAAAGKLVQDPVTGYWMDPSSRAVFQYVTDPQTGKSSYVPVHDLNMSAQVAKNIATADYYSGLGKTYNEALQHTTGEQSSLADAYRKTISDPNAPSVAREQLGQALQSAEGTQLSQAAGVGGQNAATARRTASNNMAGLAATAGQTDALLRAQETVAAQTGLGNTLGAIGGEEAGALGTTAGLGLNYSSLASGGGIAGNSNATAVRGQNIQVGEDAVKGTAAGLSGGAAPAVAAAGQGR